MSTFLSVIAMCSLRMSDAGAETDAEGEEASIVEASSALVLVPVLAPGGYISPHELVEKSSIDGGQNSTGRRVSEKIFLRSARLHTRREENARQTKGDND